MMWRSAPCQRYMSRYALQQSRSRRSALRLLIVCVPTCDDDKTNERAGDPPFATDGGICRLERVLASRAVGDVKMGSTRIGGALSAGSCPGQGSHVPTSANFLKRFFD
jgi:hypothetical protein